MTESKEDWLDRLITEFRKQAQGLYGIDREVFKQAIRAEIAKAEKRGTCMEAWKATEVAKNHSMNTATTVINTLATRRDQLQSELKAMEGKEAKM